MSSSRWTGLLALLVVGALAVSGCGGDADGSALPVEPAAPVDCGGKQELRAGGSAVQQNAIQQFVYAYGRSCPGQTLDYNATGSGAGVDDFIAGAADFAGSDTVLDPVKGQPERAAERCGSPVWQLPMVFGPIAVTYHLDGVDNLTLDAPTLAKIFNGAISSWDNPAIKALNETVPLPSTPIHVVYRAEKSGLTTSFQRYLDVASDGGWYSGGGETFNGVGESAAGNSGVAAALLSSDGSITYSEWSFAVGKQLPMARIITAASPHPVSISTDSVAKTIAAAKFLPGSPPGNDLVLDPASMHKPSQAGAYPIVTATYEIVCSKYPDAVTGAAVKAFLQAAVGPGQDGLDQYGSIRLPDGLRSKLLTAVDALS